MRKSLIILTIIIAFFYSIKVYSLNSKVTYPVVQRYRKGEVVDIETNFFNSSRENMNGYSVTVIETELVPVVSFCDKYNVIEKDELLQFDYIYMVKVNFQNKSNALGEDAGINIGEYMITNGSYMNFYCNDAYQYVNEFKSSLFSLRQGTNKEFIIPFAIDEQFINSEDFKKGNPKLIISLYPYQKEILLL